MIKNRNRKIFEMSERGMSLSQMSQKFKVSPERIRQIITFEPNFCFRHSKYFKTVCPYCEVEKTYKQVYAGYQIRELVEIGKDLAKLGRTREEILKKRIYVKVMRDNFKYSFSSIGRLLKKDHTTIMGLYYNG